MDSIRTVLDSLFTFPNVFWVLFPIIVGLTWNYFRRPCLDISPHEKNPFKIMFSDTLFYVNHREEINFLLRLTIRCHRLKIFGKEIPVHKPAIKCHCWIEFYDCNGKPVCKEAMLARLGRLSSADTKYNLKFAEAVADIDSGDKTVIDVVIRFDDQKVCYGVWQRMGYGSRRGFTEKLPKVFDEEWHQTDEYWRLDEGIYKIRVLIKSHGKILKKEYFRLINIGSIQQFRLERTAPFTVEDT